MKSVPHAMGKKKAGALYMVYNAPAVKCLYQASIIGQIQCMLLVRVCVSVRYH